MAEESSSQQKSEDATPKRLREARKKGQVSKSRDLNTVVILIAAFTMVGLLIPYFYKMFEEAIVASIGIVSRTDILPEDTFPFLQNSFELFVKMMAPYLLVLSIVAVAVSFFQVGAIFSTEPIMPQAKRLNIIENVKNMFKMTTFIELIKNVFKIGLVFYFAYVVLKNNIDQILLTTTTGLKETAQILSTVITAFLFRVLVMFTLLAIIDIMVQRWQYKKQLRMTKDEVKREYKQDEGDPIIKSVRKQLHQELAMGDTKRAVSASDVVITNPTHLAIAIQYDEKEMMAPTVMTKGQRLFAQTIRDMAEEEGIPIIRNVPLAWSLIEVEVGQEIPEDLYKAMAEVLTYVYQMKGKPV